MRFGVRKNFGEPCFRTTYANLADGRNHVVEKIFIFAEETFLLPSVKYIELFGTDVETGEEIYEKFLP